MTDTSAFTLADFDFALPPELIAQHPAAERSASRLLDGRGALPVDRVFRDLPQLLEPGDLLVFNDTRVIKARLLGEKPTGGAVEALVERVLPGHEVLAHLRASKSPQAGRPGALRRRLRRRGAGPRPGPRTRCSTCASPPTRWRCCERHGHVPLPPYITHADDARRRGALPDRVRRTPGAVAAPTAALHFDDAVLAALDARGVRRAAVTLHVGAGTFQPVRTENLAEHRMHSEWFEVGAATVAAIEATRAAGGRIVAVGTTTLRALESAAHAGVLAPFSGETEIFIRPASSSASSTGWSPTSTCRGARC